MAPFLVSLLGSGLRLVANAALVKGKEYIKEKTGVDIDQGALTEEEKGKLRQFQAEHEEELLRLQLEDNKLSLEETKAYLADVADARKNQTSILTSPDAPWFAKAIQPALALLTVLTTIFLFVLFVCLSGNNSAGVPKINPDQKDIIIYILGVLSAAVTQILGYYFGSSQSSAEKTKNLNLALQQRQTGGDQ